jgi:hypothetical protein
MLLLSAIPAVLIVGGAGEVAAATGPVALHGVGGPVALHAAAGPVALNAAGAEPVVLQAAAAEPVALTAVSEPVADLLPGRTGSAQFTVTNPNGFGVRLVSLFFDRVKSSSNPVGCPAGLLATNDLQPAGGLFVPASGRVSFVVPGALTLSAAATDVCLGVTFVVETRAVGVEDDRGVGAVPPAGTGPGPSGSPGPVAGAPEAGVLTGMGHEGPAGAQVGNSGANRGKLAFTGVSLAVPAGVALALLVAGITMRLGARRRRAQGARR